MRMLFPEFPNSAPNENPNTDMHSRTQWGRVPDEKTGALPEEYAIVAPRPLFRPTDLVSMVRITLLVKISEIS